MNKLQPIAELIKRMLEDKFNINAKYSLEIKKDWLLNIPDKNLYYKFWDEIELIYSKLVDNRFFLEDQICLTEQNNKRTLSRIDIWFEEPYNFICEFDEKQHFNQFRQITLENSYKNFEYCLDYESYLNFCKSKKVRRGISGYDKIKSEDLLFPKMYDGEKQDNRQRQRAFRDFLKDTVPFYLGYNPTIRISYEVTNRKIRNFTTDDLKCIEQYLLKNSILNKIKIQ